jgi:hypothetical protein
VAKLKKLIIHPGFHKTGTTALQQALSEVRDELSANGFNYPKIAGNAHHRAAWSIIEKTWGWKKRGGRLMAPVEWQRLDRKLRSSKDAAIISSEFFSEANAEQLQVLKKNTQKADVQVIFTWRPLPFMLASSYQQYLKYGLKLSYPEWLESIFETSGKAKFTPSFWKRNLHGDVVSKWAKVFGSGNISLIAVNEADPNFLYSSFSDLAGVPNGIIREPLDQEINRSLTFNESSLLLEINRTYPKDLDWDSYEIFIRKGNIKALTGSPAYESSDEKILTPDWAVAKAAELNSKSVAQIKALGVKIIGDIDRNDFSRIPTGTNAPVSTISIATAARAMIGVDMVSLERMHGKAISKEFFDRLKKIIKRRLHLN